MDRGVPQPPHREDAQGSAPLAAQRAPGPRPDAGRGCVEAASRTRGSGRGSVSPTRPLGVSARGEMRWQHWAVRFLPFRPEALGHPSPRHGPHKATERAVSQELGGRLTLVFHLQDGSPNAPPVKADCSSLSEGAQEVQDGGGFSGRKGKMRGKTRGSPLPVPSPSGVGEGRGTPAGTLAWAGTLECGKGSPGTRLDALLGAGLGAGGAVLALEGVQQLLALGAGPEPRLGGLLAPGESTESLAPPPQLRASSGRTGIKGQYLCQQKTFAERLSPPAEARPPPAAFSRCVSPGPSTPFEQTSGRGGAGPASLGVPSSPPRRGRMRVLGAPGGPASAGQEAGQGGRAARDRGTPVGGLEPTLPSARGSLADLISVLLGAHFPVGALSARS